MSCRHTKSSFYTLRRLRHILWKESSLETQEQSVGSGEKAGQKFSSTGERAPGYRLLPDHFQNFRRMPAPDWAQKMLCIIVPNRRTHLQSSFHVFVHEGYCLDHGLCGSCTKEMHAVRKLLVWYKIPIWFQITVCLKTKDVFLSCLFQLTYFIKCKQTLLELNSYQPYPSSWEEWIVSLLVYALHKT